MVVTSPGGQIRTCSICSRVSIVIKGVEFRTGLIVIDSSGIDVILGMETPDGESVLIVLSGQFTCQHLMAKR